MGSMRKESEYACECLRERERKERDCERMIEGVEESLGE